MIGGVHIAAPGVVGYVLGGLLIVVSVALLVVRVRRQRRWLRDPRRAAFGVPDGRWHPVTGEPPPREPVTELLPRCADAPDATTLIPRQRSGGRRG